MKVKVKVVHIPKNVRICPKCGRRVSCLPKTAMLIQREIIMIPVEQHAA